MAVNARRSNAGQTGADVLNSAGRRTYGDGEACGRAHRNPVSDTKHSPEELSHRIDQKHSA